MKSALLPVLALVLLLPAAARAQTRPVDLTAAFIAAGVMVEDLVVYEVGDIVLIRGTATTPARAATAVQFAARSGYLRVANLIEIVPAVGDAAIVALAHHRLEMARGLRGCSFTIDATDGSVRLGGQVQRENQELVAITLVSSIGGVTAVRSSIRLANGKTQTSDVR